MAVCTDHFAQCGGEDGGVRVRLSGPLDHRLEAFDLRSQVRAAFFRSFDAQAELEIFFVAHEDIGGGGDLGEDAAQFLLAVFPEGRAVVQVEADARAVLPGGARKFQSEPAGVGRQCGDQS